MNFKKITSLLTVLVCLSSLTACTLTSNTENEKPVPQNQATVSNVATNNNSNSENDPDIVPEINPDDNNASGSINNPGTFKMAEEFEIPDYNDLYYTEEQLMEASNAYMAYLEELHNEYDTEDYPVLHFMPISLNKSNLLDLAYSVGSYHAAGVVICRYDFDSKQVKEIGTYGGYGSMMYYPGLNIVEGSYSGMGYTYIQYSYIDDKGNEVVLQTFEDSLYVVDDYEDYFANPDKYLDEGYPEVYVKIDDQDVTLEEYRFYQECWNNTYNYYCKSLYNDAMLPYEGGFVPFTYNNAEYGTDTLNSAVSKYQDIIDAANSSSFGFINLVNCYVPALVVSVNGTDEYDIYQYYEYDDKAYCFGRFEISDWYKLQYLPGCDLLISTFWSDEVYEEAYYRFDWNLEAGANNFLTVGLTLFYSGDYIEGYESYINQRPVTSDYRDFVGNKLGNHSSFITLTPDSLITDTAPESIEKEFLTAYENRIEY